MRSGKGFYLAAKMNDLRKPLTARIIALNRVGRAVRLGLASTEQGQFPAPGICCWIIASGEPLFPAG